MVYTKSTLLIACKELSCGSFSNLTPNGPICIPNAFCGMDFIHVIAFNCDKACEFETCFQELIQELEKHLSDKKSAPNVENSIKFLTNKLTEIRSKQYEHEIPKKLLQIVEKDLKSYNIKKDQMMYLSVVSSID